MGPRFPPRDSGGAEPSKWAHEEEGQGNGLLFAPPQTGAGKSGAGARGQAGCSAPTGTWPPPGLREQGRAQGAGRLERTGDNAGRQAEGPGLRERVHQETWSEDLYASEADANK